MDFVPLNPASATPTGLPRIIGAGGQGTARKRVDIPGEDKLCATGSIRHADSSEAALGVGHYRNGLTYWQSFEKHPQINMTTITDCC